MNRTVPTRRTVHHCTYPVRQGTTMIVIDKIIDPMSPASPRSTFSPDYSTSSEATLHRDGHHKYCRDDAVCVEYFFHFLLYSLGHFKYIKALYLRRGNARSLPNRFKNPFPALTCPRVNSTVCTQAAAWFEI